MQPSWWSGGLQYTLWKQAINAGYNVYIHNGSLTETPSPTPGVNYLILRFYD